ncbi:type IV secretory system conjugative DNA transfer family protein [Nitrosovibrio sp. Nv6]|uniref:type IV secretory system conjugative DNA transfer family protein n=1 Tax=Nitrosovibrio sp. Nv6 TaxID=1855340 RepID=UPI0008C100FB|nr:type IV secretory system conjugative DNA transfer family protein [Nitrosovibrio sp. Nv6]SEP42803.1 type IV secretion system protein VirD4 [Nitrosovibrio sp. Nv6]
MKQGFDNTIGPQVRRVRTDRSPLILILVVITLLGGLSSATQYFAHLFQYHASLGWNFSSIYPPWRILEWARDWQQHYPSQFSSAGGVGIIVTAVGFLAVLALKTTITGSKPNPYLHGSARWAERKDIEAAGLLPRASLFARLRGQAPQVNSGVYVGSWLDKQGRQHYLRHEGPQHVLCYAPTRSGKGVGLIVPTLLSWPESAVITDLKGELWELTAGWRQRHAKNKVLRFEPASAAHSAHWNALEEIRLGTDHEVGDIQNLATLIVDPDGKGLESHWQKTAQALLVGVILHALYKAAGTGITPSLSDVDDMLADPDRDIQELWMEMNQHPGAGPNQRLISASARDMLDRHEEEAGSIVSSVKSYLSLYRDPVVRQNISDSHFRIKDLMHHDNPISLYIVTSPDDKTRLRPLVRVMINMIVRLLAGKMTFENGRPKAHYKHRLLAMLDEFPSMGKLDIMQESLAFLGGYGIMCYLVCQDINQLKSRDAGYGPDETITSNCHIQNAFPPNRIETAEHLSKLTGQTTILKEQTTRTGRGVLASGSQVSRTKQEIQRSLLTVDECLRMPGPVKVRRGDEDLIEEAGDMIIYVAGFPAIYGKQPLYFKDPVFQARAEIPASGQSDRLI